MVFAEAGSGIGEMVGGLIGLATMGKGGKDELKQAVQLYKDIQDPKYDWSKIKQDQLTLLAKWYPETYEAKVPKEVKLAQDSPQLRQAQLQGIDTLSKMAEQGLPTMERLMVEEAQGKLRSELGSARQQALRNLVETGRGGAGAELATGLATAQQGSNLARQQGSDLIRAALENRLNAASQLASQAGTARQQDINLSQQQADTINRYNQWMSEIQTNAAANAANTRNAADLRNVSEAQRIAEQNAANKTSLAQYNQQNQNQLQTALAQFQLQKAAGTAGALGNLSNAKYAEQAQRLQAAKSIGKGAGQTAGSVFDVMSGAGVLGTGMKGLVSPGQNKFFV